MMHHVFFSFFCVCINAVHFNGGSITWSPVDPHATSGSIVITITQSYSWTYPTIACANDVPITTVGRASQNSNLTCVVDCSTDGGYSLNPIDILTDCVSASTLSGTMASQRSKNVTLNVGAHFYLAYLGNTWRSLNSPPQAGLQWSIVTYIDLSVRPDGIINTPPVATIVSPQYVTVNVVTQIDIPVFDVNSNDDVRCRWSKYTPGYRRRRKFDKEDLLNSGHSFKTYKQVNENIEIIHLREKRQGCGNCSSACNFGCSCNCSVCSGTTCTNGTCGISPNCSADNGTTPDTPGTLAPTSSYAHRQAIDECGGICYLTSLPNGTNLTGCTISFLGLVPGTWYAAAIQVEDFISATDTVPMSSVPAQFLIYVMPTPNCTKAPIIEPLTGCLDVTIGNSTSFNLTVHNLCNPASVDISSLVVTKAITGMQSGNLTHRSGNASIVYMTFTWTPQTSQFGRQQMCVIAYTSEMLQSQTYCVTFNVTNSYYICSATTTILPRVGQSQNLYLQCNVINLNPIFSKQLNVTRLNWEMIAGLISLALVLALCCCGFMYLAIGRATRHRKEEPAESEVHDLIEEHRTSSRTEISSTTMGSIVNNATPQRVSSLKNIDTSQKMTTAKNNETSAVSENIQQKAIQRNCYLYVLPSKDLPRSTTPAKDESKDDQPALVQVNGAQKHVDQWEDDNTETNTKTEDPWGAPPPPSAVKGTRTITRSTTMPASSGNSRPKSKGRSVSFNKVCPINQEEKATSSAKSTSNVVNRSFAQFSAWDAAETKQTPHSKTVSFDFDEWARIYTLGKKQKH